jgi:hypothetical protein
VFRKIGDEVLLVPVRNNVHNLASIHSLNVVGSRVWELIDGARSVEEIRDAIADEFDVSREEAGADIGDFLASLLSVNAVGKAG